MMAVTTRSWTSVLEPCGDRHQRKMLGGDLLSHPVPRAVPSAQTGLASGFGMEPGVSPSLWPPKHYGDDGTGKTRPHLGNRIVDANTPHTPEGVWLWQVVGLLVLVSFMRR